MRGKLFLVPEVGFFMPQHEAQQTVTFSYSYCSVLRSCLLT